MAMGSQLRTQKRDGLPPEKTLRKSEVVSTPSCAWCPKPRLPEWIMTCGKGNEHLVLEEIDLRGGKGSP